MATQKEIDDWYEKRKMDKELCDWFNGLTPEQKKSFFRGYSPQKVEESRKVMDKEIMNAEKNTVVSTDTPKTSPNTMTREEFEALEKNNPMEAMNFCLKHGKIVEGETK